MRFVLALLPLVLSAQTMQIRATLPTSAIVAVTSASGACTTVLTYVIGGGTVASTPTQTNQGSTAVLVFQGLATSTGYNLAVTGCATVSGAFTTPAWPRGSTYPMPFPTNSANWGNRAGPAVTINTATPVVDPVYGGSLTPVGNSTWFTWRTGGSSAVGTSGIAAESTYTAGTWTPQSTGCDIAHGSTACYSTTTGTTPMDLYYNLIFPAWNNGTLTYANTSQILHDLGIIVYASGVPFTAQLIFNGAAVGSAFTVTPGGTGGGVLKLTGSAGDPDGAFPTNFPSPGFTGWGSPALTTDRLSTYPTVTASSGTLTIATPSSNYAGTADYFSDTLGAGSKILCGTTLGTVATNVNAGQITTTGLGSLSGTQTCSAYGWGIRITPSGGTLNVGIRLKLAGNYTTGAQALGTSFQPVTFVHNGENFALAVVTTSKANEAYIGAFGDNGTIVPLSAMNPPSQSAPDGPNSNAPAHPASAGYFWDTSTAGVFYDMVANQSTPAGYSIYKVDLSGQLASLPAYDQNYATTAIGNGWPSDGATWTNLTPPSTSKDIETQIEAYDSRWSANGEYAKLYGPGGGAVAWVPANASNISFVGTTGHYGVVNLTYGGQNGAPDWIAVFDLSTGLLFKLVHTLDATGIPGVTNCASHSVQTFAFPLDTIYISCDQLSSNNTSKTMGGPFQFSTMTISKSGSMSSDTSLPTAIGAGNGYDAACPGTIAAQWQALGATGNNCFTMDVARGGPNNIAAGATEKSYFPSAWASPCANCSQPYMLVPGMMFDDVTNYLINASERFRVVLVTDPSPAGSTLTRVVVQRNADWDVQCSNTQGAHSGGICQTFPTLHANGWNAQMGNGQNNSYTSGASYVWSLDSNTVQEISPVVFGHFYLGHGTVTDATNTYISSPGVIDRPASQLGALPTVYNPFQVISYYNQQGFAGNPSLIGSGIVQSYTNTGQNAPSPFAADTNQILGQSAIPEAGDGTLGARTMGTTGTTNVYTLTQVSVTGWSGLTNSTYRQLGLYGWAGRYTLQDVSGPASSSISALAGTAFSMCYVYAAGECYSGSTAGTIYVNVPQAYSNGQALVGISWANSPTVVPAIPMTSEWRTFDIRSQDYTGVGSAAITSGLCGPGYGYAVTGEFLHPTGKYMLVPGPCNMSGIGQMGFYAKVPPFTATSALNNTFLNVPVTFPIGAGAYARIKFGYNSSYNCSPFADVCVTDPSLAPYAFLTVDTLTAQSCSGGCTIPIPAIAGRVVYFQRQVSSDGTTWNNYMGMEIVSP